MRVGLITIALLISCGGASAADVSMTLSDEEQSVLRQILDVATKAGGLQIAPVTLHFSNKLDALQKPPAKPKPEEPK